MDHLTRLRIPHFLTVQIIFAVDNSNLVEPSLAGYAELLAGTILECKLSLAIASAFHPEHLVKFHVFDDLHCEVPCGGSAFWARRPRRTVSLFVEHGVTGSAGDSFHRYPESSNGSALQPRSAAREE